MRSIRPILLTGAILLLAIMPTMAEQEEMSAADQACLLAMTPGENHEFLASLAGNWRYSGSYWQSASAEPVPFGGSSENEMILDGRYLLEHVTSEMPGAVRFEGIGYLAFDNAAGEFKHTWIDNMSTALGYSTGELDASGRVLTMRSKFTDPATGREGRARSVTRYLDENRHTLELWSSVAGEKEWKAMEFEYVRESGT
jgi:hypothetical protein